MDKEDVKSIAQSLQALAQKLSKFSGEPTENLDDWLAEFHQYCINTRCTSSRTLADGTNNPNYGVKEMEILKAHLVGPARMFLKTLTGDETYDEFLTKLRSRFALTTSQKFNQKLSIFGAKQRPDESLESFV